jgi:hypothetical protein
MNDQPNAIDPLTILAQMAVQLHELYLSYVAAGFSEAQALYLVGKLIEASTGTPT